MLDVTMSAALAARSILPNRRLPWVWTATGDSRAAAIYTDAGAFRVRGAGSALNWANTLLDHRMVIGACFGVSGERTDQVLARIAQPLATNAGNLYVLCGINNLGQVASGGSYAHAVTGETVTIANVAEVTFRDLRDIHLRASAAGMNVLLEYEPGANLLNTAALQTAWIELNARIYEYAEVTPGLFTHDARGIMLVPNQSDTALAMKAGYTYDNLHPAALGAFKWGKSLAPVVDRMTPARAGVLMQNRAETVANGRRQLIVNPMFSTATGGTLANGATGTVPSGWTGRRQSTSDTVAFSTQADPDGFGNNVVIDSTFTAASVSNSNYARLSQDVALAQFDAGDIVEAIVPFEVVGAPTGLRSVRLLCQCNTTPTGNQDSMDLFASDGWAGPDEAYKGTLKTRPYVVPANTAKSWLNLQIYVDASGAGTSKVVIKRAFIRRRLAV